MLKSRTCPNSGFLLAEVAVGAVLTAVLLGGVAVLVWANQDMAVGASVNAETLSYVSSDMEYERQSARNDFASIVNSNQSSGSLSRHVYVAELSSYAKEVVTESFPFGQMQKHGSRLSGTIYDYKNILGKDTCDVVFVTNWQNPKTLGSLDLGTDNPATGVDVSGQLAYVSTNSSTVSKEDFFIVNVADKNNLVKLSGINTGPGLMALHAAGGYVFAANTSLSASSGQLEVISVANPFAPAVVTHRKAPGVSSGLGRSIFFYNQKVFLGLTKTTGAELHIYDVSLPWSPVWLGSYETNSTINDIYVSKDKAFLAVAEGHQMQVLDVSNPSAISELGYFSNLSLPNYSAQSVTALGGRVFFARSFGGTNDTFKPEIFSLDAGSPDSIVQSGAQDLGFTVSKMFLRDGKLFVATNASNKEFVVFDVSDPASISLLSSLDLPANASGVDCEGQYVFVSVLGQPALQTIGQ